MTITLLAIGALHLVDGPEGPAGGGVADACAIARAHGDRVAVASRVGLDASGREIVAALSARGVDCTTIQTDPDLPTGRRTLRAGTARLDAHCAFDNLQWDSDLEAAARAADCVVADAAGRRHGQARSTIDRTLLTAASAVRVVDLVARPPQPVDRLDREWVGRALELASIVVVDRVALASLVPAVADPVEAAARLRNVMTDGAALLCDGAHAWVCARGGTTATAWGASALAAGIALAHAILAGDAPTAEVLS